MAYQQRILFALAYFNFLCVVCSNGVFQLKLLRFINDEGFDETGKCCTNPTSSACSAPCRTGFRICLTHYQSNVDQASECTYGEIKTPAIGGNTFNPESSLYIEQHPIQFDFSFRWPVSFSLVIDVLHIEDTLQGQTETVISRLVKSAETQSVKPGPNTWTRPEPYRHRLSVLQYEYRVVCVQDLYGSDCGTFCRPRNDKLGHYKCNDKGEKVCLDGWTRSDDNNAYCTKAVCSSCRGDRGVCTAPEKCECNNGWNGTDCSQCIKLPDCAHGTCTQPYQCKCLPGWGGSFCNQDLNYCTNNQPCRNGATCANTGEGSYSCTCRPGFIGVDCQVELNECDAHPCQNGAQCIDMINDYKCVCPANFYGSNCSSTDVSCSDSPCLNGGTCTEDEDKHYSCICKAEWNGVNCGKATNSCGLKPCDNNGTCQVTATGYLCSCTDGYSGKNCEIASSRCGDLLCLNGGSCLDSAIFDRPCKCRHCLCPTEYFGSRCERSIATNIPVKLPDFDSQLGVVYSKKTTTYIEENHTETKIVGGSKPHSLTTSQWLAICIGAVALVLLLIVSVTCLVYNKRKGYALKKQHQYKEPTVEPQNTRNIDLSIITDHSSPGPAIIRERNFQKRLSSEVRLSTSSFQQKAKRPHSADVDWESDRFERSQSRSCGKSPIVLNACQRYSNHVVRPVQDGMTCVVEEAIPLRRVSCGSSPMRHSNPEGRVQKKEGYTNRPRSFRHSLTRPPTYEEACRDALVKNGPQQTNSIAI